MKAFQISRPREFQAVEAPIPALSNDQSDRLIVKTVWASICGSDIPFYIGNKEQMNFPLPAGSHIHECVGKVVESQSDRFDPGDYVLAIPEDNLGLAEYFIAMESKAVKLDPQTAQNGASTIIQPLSTVLNAADRLELSPDSTVGVIGLGSIGLLFCWVLLKRGVNNIIGIDPIASRCEVAENLGIERTICSTSSDAVTAIQAGELSWDPPDICIEAVGHQMATLDNAVSLVRYKGTVLAFGVPDQDIYTFNFERFFRKNAQLIAAVTPEWHTYLAMARDIYYNHSEELGAFATHHIPIKDVQKAFTIYENHQDEVCKIVLDASEW